jgi:nicotinate-nucleotide adenylyltransferase
VSANRIGILGGSFDPVHIGHLLLAQTAHEQAHLDRIMFVPAGHQWRKAEREMTPATQRLEMVRLAVDDVPYFEVSEIEVEREGPSYSDVTLEQVHDANPAAELFFILGYDALADLPHWHAPQRVCELATLAVAARADGPGLAASHAALGDLSARIVWLDMPQLEISASVIRERAKAGLPLRWLVPDAVADYIAAQDLYCD